jgi:glutamate synthase (NADPH/NADH) large chain
VDPAKIIKSGRLQPGKMFLVDLAKGKIISDEELKKKSAVLQPYKEWLDSQKIRLEELPAPRIRFTMLQADDI